jgi:hypothetical protein
MDQLVFSALVISTTVLLWLRKHSATTNAYITDLFIYPVKGLKGIRVTSAVLDARGFEWDRRYMIIDGANVSSHLRTSAKSSVILMELAGQISDSAANPRHGVTGCYTGQQQLVCVGVVAQLIYIYQ